ncbi:MAG TPA: hypothetical protein VF734_11450 [Pseudonocardiaceae bacterium]
MEQTVLKVIGILLVAWLVLAIIGAVIKGLFWLTIIGAVLFVGTAVAGYLHRRSSSQGSLH